MNLLNSLLSRAGYLNRNAHHVDPEIALKCGVNRPDFATGAWLDLHVGQYANLATMNNAGAFATRSELRTEFHA
jgi:hypothetical protein